MSAKRGYFYADPVAALYMAKTFRMKLTGGGFCLQPESVDACLDLLARGTRPDRFEVSADSLSVLDPKAGDVVEETANGKTKLRRLVPRDFPLAGSAYLILQRGGKPFHTPDRAKGDG